MLNRFRQSINRFMYAVLLGHYLMKMVPPKIVLFYVANVKPEVTDGQLWIILSSLRNANNLKSIELELMVKKMI